MKFQLNREEIEKITPHRSPMLLLDEVALDNENVAHGKYTVKGDEYFLQGHFPDNPVVPGVIQCEIMAQTAVGIFAEDGGKTPVLTTLTDVKFRKLVKPGDTIETTCKVVGAKKLFHYCEATASVNGAKCAEAKFSFAVVDKDKV